MLVKLGLVEQRHKAVLEVLGGAQVTDVARRYGVTRQTVHTWLRRYGSSGIAGLLGAGRTSAGAFLHLSLSGPSRADRSHQATPAPGGL